MTAAATANPAPPSTLWQWLTLLGVALVMATAASLVAREFSVVWLDEVLYADPAVNWALGRGFTSAVWPGQQAGAPHAASFPLYPVMLSGWFALAGVERASLFSFAVPLMAVGAVFWAQAASAWGLVRASRSGVLFVVLLSSAGYACYAFGRYDPPLVLLSGMAFWLAAREYWLGLFAVGVIAAWGGPQPFVGAMAAALTACICGQGKLAWRGWPFFTGGAAGAVLLAAWLASRGTLATFLSAHQMHATTANGWNWLSGLADPSLLLLLAAASWGALCWSGHAALCCRAALLLPVLVAALLLGRVTVYYVWLALFPMAALVLSAVEAHYAHEGTRRGVLVLGAALLLAWIPAAWWLIPSATPGRQPALADRFVHACLGEQEIAVVDYAAYWPAQAHSRQVVTAWYARELGPPPGATVALLRPEEAEVLGPRWGWLPTGERFGPVEPTTLSLLGLSKPLWDYRLVVLRPPGISRPAAD